MSDYPDWQEPQAHANAIASTGVPLLSAQGNLLDLAAQIIAGGGQYQSNPLSLTQLGYATYIALESSGLSANPFVRVQFVWSDSNTSQITGEDNFWVVGSGSSPGWVTLGSGPAKGNILTIWIYNQDPSLSCTVKFMLAQDSMVRVVDRWRWQNSADTSLTLPGITPASLVPDETHLGFLHAVSIPAGQTDDWLFGMAPGQNVQLSGITSGTTPSNIVLQVQPAPTSEYSGASICLYENLANAGFDYTFVAARAPLLLKVTNNATSGSATLSCAMFAQD